MRRFAGALVPAVAVALAMLILVPDALALRVKINGRVYGVMPAVGAQLSAAATRGSIGAGKSPFVTPSLAAPAGWNVQYQGGPVLHTTAPYVIYWDPSGGISPTSRGIINRYLTDVAADSGEADDTYGVGRQYYDSAGYADAGTAFTASSQAIVDTDSYPTTSNCPAESGFSNCITDAQLRAELAGFISAHALPTDGPGSESEFPAGAPVYFLILPATVNTCIDSTGSVCSGGPQLVYCGYHSAYANSNGDAVLYANVPFSVFTTVGTKGCQQDNTSTSTLQAPNGDDADNIVDILSHELNEVITDPAGDAWVNAGGDGNELADQCVAYGSPSDPTSGVSVDAYVPIGGNAAAGSNTFGSLFDQLINGDRYYTQSLWSNGQVNCEMQPTAATLVPSFTAGHVGQAITLDPTATDSSAGAASATWSFGDGSSSFVPGSLAPTTHSFSGPGQYTVKLTVVDAYGNVASTSKQVVVGTNPTASIGALPASVTVGTPVAFSGSSSTDPNTGATTSYLWNFGDNSTATGVTTSHTYNTPGTYTVSLDVSDSWDFSNVKTATISVVRRPAGKISNVRTAHSRRSAYVVVTVSEAGRISYAGHSSTAAAGRAVKLKLKLTARQLKLLKHGRRFTLTIQLSYTPAGESKLVKVVHLRL